MPRTHAQLEQAAANVEEWLDNLDPETIRVEDIEDLRCVADAVQRVADAQGELVAAVRAARAAGRSWGRISMALGTSRQAAYERFAEASDQ
ncbi:MAG: sigma-70 family RNA polymerase sigma factor [Acidimicrobiales bacterium]